MRQTAHTHTRQRGFTILEITIVVLVIVVLAAIAIPAIGYWLEEYRLGIATQQIADTIQTAKMNAIAKTRRTEVLFDVAGNRIGREGSTLEPLPAGVRFGVGEARTPPDDAVEMSGPVTFPPLPENADLRAAAFTPRGLPDAEPGETFAVFVTNSTGTSAVLMTSAGNVRAVRWNGEKWQ